MEIIECWRVDSYGKKTHGGYEVFRHYFSSKEDALKWIAGREKESVNGSLPFKCTIVRNLTTREIFSLSDPIIYKYLHL